MSVSETFDRKFNKCMRGYIPEEVDDALDAILRYCDDLETANKEFEVANNDLIDEKYALTSEVEALKKQNTDLEKKIGELSASLSKIEGVYNEYRTKFGEARNLVVGAKTSASEIVSRAEAKAAEIAKESEEKSAAILAGAEEKREETLEFLENKRVSALAELDREIKSRKEKADTEIGQKEERIAELDRTYSGLCAFLTEKLTEMLGTVSGIREKTVDTAPDGDKTEVKIQKREFEFEDFEEIETEDKIIPIESIAEEVEIPAISEEIEADFPDVPEEIVLYTAEDEDAEIILTEEIAPHPLKETTSFANGKFIKAPQNDTLDSTNDLLASLKSMISEPGQPLGNISSAPGKSDHTVTKLKNTLDRIGEQVKAKKSTPNT